MDNSNEYRKQCLRRYYENKDMYQARMFYNKLIDDGKKKAARVYAKSINEAKGYPALKEN